MVEAGVPCNPVSEECGRGRLPLWYKLMKHRYFLMVSVHTGSWMNVPQLPSSSFVTYFSSLVFISLNYKNIRENRGVRKGT